MMEQKPVPSVTAGVERLSALAGRLSAWLALATVSICACVALLRYGLGIGFIWMQELYVACFAASVLLGAANAYRTNDHVRVDVLTRKLTRRTRALMELGGIIFFVFPWMVIIIYAALAGEHSFVRAAITQREASPLEGGLPGVFLIKALIPLSALLILLQAFAIAAKSLIEAIRSDPHRQ